MNENVKAILYKRKAGSINTICKCILISFNIILMSVVGNFYIFTENFKKSEYHNNNISISNNSLDIFLADKIEMIMGVFTILSLTILAGTVALFITLGIMWTKKIKNSYKIYGCLGYTKNRVRGLIFLDNIVEYVLSIPISVAGTFALWEIIKSNEIIKYLCEKGDIWQGYNLWISVGVIILAFVVVFIESM